MEIIIVKEPMPAETVALTGGEYATNEVRIYVDANLPLREQKDRVIHSIIENYFPSITHDKVEELTEILIDGLDQIGD